MTLPHLDPGKKVKADDDWNPMVDAINGHQLTLDDLSAQLASPTAGGGISDIATRLAAIETHDTSQDSTIGNNGTRLTAVESAVGVPWSGASALSRIQSLEAGAATPTSPGGEWRFGNGPQSFAPLATDNLLKIWDTVVDTPQLITYNATTGLFTVQQDGVWDISVDLRVTNSNGGQYLAICAAGNPARPWAKNSSPNLNIHVGKVKRLTAGATFGITLWVAGGTSVSIEDSDPAGSIIPCLSAYWLHG